MQSFNRSDLYKLAREEKETTAETETRAAWYLTLCQVAAPVSVPESKSPALQRFRFFFTRQVDDGRTHYWLHFGYFASELEAQRWRNVLGRIYPRATVQREAQRTSSTSSSATQPALSETQVLKMLNMEAAAGQSGPSRPSPPAPKMQSKGLEESLNELRATAWQTLELDDTATMSGVRHLKVEIERPRKDQRSQRKPG